MPIESFAAAFARIAKDVHAATGFTLIWKDVDPALWLRLPPRLSQHRHPYCLAIKARSEGDRLACCAADNLGANDWRDDRIRRRRCPYGVVELAVPIFCGDDYQGCCYLGSSRAEPAPRGVGPGYDGLPTWRGRAVGAAARLVQELVGGIVHLRDPSPPVRDERMRRAQAYIDAHLHSGLRAGVVAAELGLSTSRFVHAFKEACGEPFSAYLQRRLMRRAAQLLAAGDRGVTAVGQALGFGNPAWFSTAFKRYHGLAPRDWQARIRRAGG